MPYPRVFLVAPLDNIANAANLPRFGKLVYLYDDTPDIFSTSIEWDVLSLFDQFDYRSDLDFFAVSGIIPLSCIALVMLTEEYGAIKTLLWDRDKRIYREKEIGGLE